MTAWLDDMVRTVARARRCGEGLPRGSRRRRFLSVVVRQLRKEAQREAVRCGMVRLVGSGRSATAAERALVWGAMRDANMVNHAGEGGYGEREAGMDATGDMRQLSDDEISFGAAWLQRGEGDGVRCEDGQTFRVQHGRPEPL